MVTSDGQVRVMDFGLARQIGQVPDAAAAAQAAEARAAEERASTSGRYLSIKLTQTGSLLGTPAYMAPEQFSALAGDARTDQFSFCVALFEGLYGGRPFPGDTLVNLMANVAAGEVAEPPPSSRVPKWIRKVLLRGLRVEPDQRFPSMDALLTALRTDPTVRPRRVVAVVAWLAFAVALAVGVRRVSGTTQALCKGGAQRWAGIWEPSASTPASASPRKEGIRRAFAGSGRSYAEQAFAEVTRVLDQYTARWIAMYTDACEATHLRGEQSAEVLDLRMSCLQERLASARALTDLFSSADRAVVENAVAAAGALPGLDRCADVTLLRAVVQPPRDEATRARVEALRAERARLVALRDAGHCADAERMAGGLIADVRRAGYAPLLAETLNAAGSLADVCIDMARGLERFHEAYAVGLASHHDEAAAEAATEIGDFLVTRGNQIETGAEWLAIGQAMVDRIGGHPLLEAWLLAAHASILTNEGKLAEALAALERSRQAKERILGDSHIDVLSSTLNIGNLLELSGRHEEALAADRSARLTMARVVGPDHPRVAMVWANEGEALNSLGRHAEARVAFEHALDIWRRSGADPYFTSFGLTGLGRAYLGEERAADALPPLEEALRIRVERRMDAEHLGEVRFALARALWSRPTERRRARALAQQARADYAELKSDATSATEIDVWLKART
jgi:tetratricopeptide (TPR) repeat protein